jgi:hypothetical protein
MDINPTNINVRINTLLLKLAIKSIEKANITIIIGIIIDCSLFDLENCRDVLILPIADANAADKGRIKMFIYPLFPVSPLTAKLIPKYSTINVANIMGTEVIS